MLSPPLHRFYQGQVTRAATLVSDVPERGSRGVPQNHQRLPDTNRVLRHTDADRCHPISISVAEHSVGIRKSLMVLGDTPGPPLGDIAHEGWPPGLPGPGRNGVRAG